MIRITGIIPTKKRAVNLIANHIPYPSKTKNVTRNLATHIADTLIPYPISRKISPITVPKAANTCYTSVGYNQLNIDVVIINNTRLYHSTLHLSLLHLLLTMYANVMIAKIIFKNKYQRNASIFG